MSHSAVAFAPLVELAPPTPGGPMAAAVAMAEEEEFAEAKEEEEGLEQA